MRATERRSQQASPAGERCYGVPTRPPAVARLLDLQRTAGNRAASRLLGTGTLARDAIETGGEIGPADGGPAVMSEQVSGGGSVSGSTDVTSSSASQAVAVGPAPAAADLAGSPPTDFPTAKFLKDCPEIDGKTFVWIFERARGAILTMFGPVDITTRKTWKLPSKWGVFDMDIDFMPLVWTGDQEPEERHVKLMVHFERTSVTPLVYRAHGEIIDWLEYGAPVVRREYSALVTFEFSAPSWYYPWGAECLSVTFTDEATGGGGAPPPSKRRNSPT